MSFPSFDSATPSWTAIDFRHRTTPHHIRVHNQREGRREPGTVQWWTPGVGAEQPPHSTVP
ncbi:hypothetical protein BDR05DRAFT_970846 [Suillus weaverae]|nr:hypothetical protein BDR05DRAFT_970846 [Suillus weaverae]